MRVISGKYKSRKLEGYNTIGVRPTMDKVKESLFAMINNYIEDSVCLDLFSGTGALGIEAISNYAKQTYFVDNNKLSIDITKLNINNLKIDNYSIVNDNYINAIKNFNNNNIYFDIIFIDPPYGVIRIEDVINNILKYNIIKNNTLIICEYEDENLKDSYNNLKLYKQKKYGKTFITIYKNEE